MSKLRLLDCNVKFVGSDNFDHLCQRETGHVGPHRCFEPDECAGYYVKGQFHSYEKERGAMSEQEKAVSKWVEGYIKLDYDMRKRVAVAQEAKAEGKRALDA